MAARTLGDVCRNIIAWAATKEKLDMVFGRETYQRMIDLSALVAKVADEGLRDRMLAVIDAQADATDEMVERNQLLWEVDIYLQADELQKADAILMADTVAQREQKRLDMLLTNVPPAPVLKRDSLAAS